MGTMFPRGENIAAVSYLHPCCKMFCAASLEQLRRFAAAVMVAAGVIMVI